MKCGRRSDLLKRVSIGGVTFSKFCDEGLHFVLQNSKPDDLISLGFGGEGEVVE
jgi:hypothetical protein